MQPDRVLTASRRTQEQANKGSSLALIGLHFVASVWQLGTNATGNDCIDNNAVGSYWLFESKTCQDTNPRLYQLSYAVVVLFIVISVLLLLFCGFFSSRSIQHVFKES